MRRYGPDPVTRAQTMAQLKTFLANCPDERLAALTVGILASMYRLDRREIECVLLAAQAGRRRFLSKGEISQ